MQMKPLFLLFTSVFLWNNIVKAQPPCVNVHNYTDLGTSLSAGLYYIDTDVYVTSDITITDTALVQQLLNTWNKTNRVDSNYAKFFTWTLQHSLGQSINLTEIETLAQRCPQTDGNVVFLSQNLYNAITNKHRIFTTACDLKSTEFPDNTTIYVGTPKDINKAIKIRQP